MPLFVLCLSVHVYTCTYNITHVCRDYIDRSFAACEGRAEDLERVQQFLKVELNDIFKQNKAWDVDWDRRPLPLWVVGVLCAGCRVISALCLVCVCVCVRAHVNSLEVSCHSVLTKLNLTCHHENLSCHSQILVMFSYPLFHCSPLYRPSLGCKIHVHVHVAATVRAQVHLCSLCQSKIFIHCNCAIAQPILRTEVTTVDACMLYFLIWQLHVAVCSILYLCNDNCVILAAR